MAMFKVLLWDLDNTILDFNLAQANSLKAAFERFGLGDCSDETIETFAEINAAHWQMLEEGKITKDEVYKFRFEALLKEIGKTGAVDPLEINEAFEKGICNTISFLDDSFNLLCSLKDDFALYCVTNGATEIQKKRLSDSKLSGIFRKVFISDEIGYDKPNKEFFDCVLANIIPCDKSEILIIGDSLTSDMKGGNNAGIKCCWYNPNSAPKPNNLRIDYEIKELAEIQKILG
jgi:2-haloacid dehalogenase